MSSFGIALSFRSFSRFLGLEAFLDFLCSFRLRRLSRSASESSPESLGGSPPVLVYSGFEGPSSVFGNRGLVLGCSSSRMYGFPVGALLLSPLISPKAGCRTVPVTGFVGVNPPIVRNGVDCTGSLIYRDRLTNRWGTRSALSLFLLFDGLRIARVVGGRWQLPGGLIGQ